MQGLSPERVVLPQKPHPTELQSLHPHLPRPVGVQGEAEKNPTPKKNPTKPHHTRTHTLHTELNTPRRSYTSGANIEQLKNL